MIRRPDYSSLPLREGYSLRASGGWRYEEKLDGRWHELGIGASTIVGELMRDGRFFAFDIPVHNGVDVRRRPLRERLAILDSFPLRRPATGNGGEFLRAVLARGGEGIVAKPLDAPYGATWFKCKRVETFDCVVTELDPWRATIRLALNGEDCGWCSARSAFDSVAVGDVVEIAAQSRHVSGKFRSPRFVRLRLDLQPRKDLRRTPLARIV